MVTEVIDIKARHKIENHEAICAERYENINKQLKQLTAWMIGLVGGTGALLGSLVLKFI